MAGKGTFVSYKQLRRLDQDFSEDLKHAENQDFMYRAEQRLRDKAKANKEEKLRQGHANIKAFKLLDTGSDTLNGTYADAIMGVAEEQHRLYDIFNDDTDKYSQQEKNKARVKFNNLSNIPENFAAMANAVMREKAQYDADLAAGNIWRDEEYEKKFENGFAGVTLSFDDNGMPVGLFRKGQSDVNKDGVKDNYDVETMDSLNDVFDRPQFMRKVDYETTAKEHAKRLKSAETDTVNGFTTTTNTGIEVDLFKKSVDALLYKNGEPTETLLSFVRRAGLDPNKPDNLKKVEEDYKNEVWLNTERGKKIDKNESAIVSNKRENRLAKEQDVSLGEAVTPTFETWGKQFKNIDTNKVNSIPVNNVKIDAIPIKGGGTITNADVVNLTYDKKGNMVVDVVYQETKSETMSEDKFAKEIKDATDNNDFAKLTALQLASDVSGGGKKVTLPGQNKKEQITISDENESKIAQKVAGSIEKVKSLVFKEQPKAKTSIKASDIKSQAEASGYTEQEYRQLLIDNGVKITN